MAEDLRLPPPLELSPFCLSLTVTFPVPCSPGFSFSLFFYIDYFPCLSLSRCLVFVVLHSSSSSVSLFLSLLVSLPLSLSVRVPCPFSTSLSLFLSIGLSLSLAFTVSALAPLVLAYPSSSLSWPFALPVHRSLSLPSSPYSSPSWSFSLLGPLWLRPSPP